MILLPCPVRPDLDCIAGALAYAEYLQRVQKRPAKAWLCGKPDGEALFYLDLFRDDLVFANDKDIRNAEAYILVDFSTINFFPEPIDANKVIEVIDHRFFHDPAQEFPNARIQLDKVGAAATLIAEYFMRDDLPPSAPVAAMLYGAIFTHTLCGNGDLCSERDRIAMAWLKQNFAEADAYVNAQLAARKQEVLDNFPEIFGTEMKMETAAFGRYGISQVEMIDALPFWQEHCAAVIEFFQKYEHPVCLNLIDLSHNTSIFYSSDLHLGGLVKKQVNLIEQHDRFFRFAPALMRKQIIPLING